MARRKLILPPPCVAVRSQITKTDCGIQAIAMVLGLPYEDVARLAPLAIRDGLRPRRFHQLGAALGVRFRYRPHADLEGQTGLLWIIYADESAHLACLFSGTLANPSDATIWDPLDYLDAFNARALFYSIEAPVQRRPIKGRRQV